MPDSNEYKYNYGDKMQEDKPIPDWKSLARKYHEMRMMRAASSGFLTQETDGINYLLMGLSAATGKVMTQAKRIFGGDADADKKAFADALAGVRIYVEQVARENRINLDDACKTHMQKVLNRMDSDVSK